MPRISRMLKQTRSRQAMVSIIIFNPFG